MLKSSKIPTWAETEEKIRQNTLSPTEWSLILGTWRRHLLWDLWFQLQVQLLRFFLRHGGCSMDALVGWEYNFIVYPNANRKLMKWLEHCSDMVVLSHSHLDCGCTVWMYWSFWIFQVTEEDMGMWLPENVIWVIGECWTWWGVLSRRTSVFELFNCRILSFMQSLIFLRWFEVKLQIQRVYKSDTVS